MRFFSPSHDLLEPTEECIAPGFASPEESVLAGFRLYGGTVQVEPKVKLLAHSHDTVEVPPLTMTLENQIHGEGHERHREYRTVLEAIDQKLNLKDGKIPDRDLGYVVHAYTLFPFLPTIRFDAANPADLLRVFLRLRQLSGRWDS